MQPDTPATTWQVLAHAARRNPRALAIEHAGRRLSYLELEQQCERMSLALLAWGVRKGDRVAIWAPNSVEWIIVAIGAQAIGGILVPINTRLKGREAGFILRRSGARLLCTVQEFLGVRYPELIAGESLPALARIVDLTAEHAPDVSISHQDLARAREQVSAHDLADILFTSGTTGEPKGVMSSHAQNLWTFRAWCAAVGLRASDRYLIVNPFFHTFGYKAGWLACLLEGATILLEPVFDASVVMRRIVTDHISVLPGPPALFQSMLAHELCGRIDLSSLRLAVTGAASVPPVLIERMRQVLGFQSVLTGYGLTESTGVVTICRHGDSDERVAFTCGAPIPGIEVKCVDEQGASVSAGEAGEVLVRGPNVMQGYFRDERATAETIDAEGWLHTGDMGVFDAEGYLRITDRKKDLFIVGGFNCYPAEIEKILSAHPAVAQVAVIGVPDERLGEVAQAFIVPRPEAQTDAASIIAWCRDNMANFKVPRYVQFVSALPSTASGKVQKFELRAQAAQATRR